MISGFFLCTSAIVTVIPGPDAAMVAYLVLSTGRRMPAAAAAAGMLSAGAGYAVLALSGTSLLLRTQPEAFTVLRWCGAGAMLAWGLRALWHAARLRGHTPAGPGAGIDADIIARPAGRRATSRRWYLTGLACTGSNPKVGLFLLAYLPQFVPAHAQASAAMALLAAVYLALGAVWLAFLIVSVHLVRRRLGTGGSGRQQDAKRQDGRQRGAAAFLRLSETLLGFVFVAFAVRLGLGS